MFSIILSVVKFELARSLTPGRLAIWFLLVGFPIVLIGMLRLNGIGQGASEFWGIRLYFLCPEVLCLLALLLWATPVVSTEIEGQTWGYLAMRPSG